MGDEWRRLPQERCAVGDQRVGGEAPVAGQRAEPQPAVLAQLDPPQFGEVPDVHQQLGGGEPHRHGGQQARAAGQRPRLFAPPFADVVARAERPMLQPIYDLVSPAMVRGRIALVGDAAFVARPHTGMGVTKAALDALALVAAFAGDTPDLARLERARLAANHAVVARGRELGRYFERSLRAADDRAAFAELARVVVRETAVAPRAPEPAASAEAG